MNKQVIAAGLVFCLTFSGCQSYQIAPPPGPSGSIGTEGSNLRLTFADGSTHRIANAVARGDSVTGTDPQTGREIAFASKSITRYESEHFSGGRTAALTFGVAAGAFALAAVVIVAAWTSFLGGLFSPH